MMLVQARKTTLALMISAALSSSVLAADNNTVTGTVTDVQKSTVFSGAEIRLEELNRSVASDRQGKFRFASVPDGTYTLVVTYLGAETQRQTIQISGDEIKTVAVTIGEDSAKLDNVLVVGQAAGQAAAINQQKAADNLVSVVSSDAIGQFPDQNLTEALQRVSGVSITRDQGEGRFVVIRGIDPNLNAISINGARVPSAESDQRQVALDVIPSEILETLEIHKSLRPDLPGDAIGGRIEVKGLTAFDRADEQTGNLRVEGSYNDLVEETSPKVSGAYTRLFDVGDGVDNFGIAASFSWFDRDFGSENMESDGGWPLLEAPDGSEIRGMEAMEYREYTINRERLGLGLNFDYRPTDDSHWYLRTLYSDFTDQEKRHLSAFKFDEGDIAALTADSAAFTGAEVEKELKSRLETQTIASYVLGNETQINDWTIDGAIAFSKAKEDEPGALDAIFKQEDVDLNYARINRALWDVSGSANLLQAAGYELDEVEFTNNLTEDEEWNVSLNAEKQLFWGDQPGSIKFGVRYGDRDKYNDGSVTIYDDFGGDFSIADFLTATRHFSLANFGPAINETAFRNFFFSNQSQFGIDADATAEENLGEDFEISEEILSAYVMGTVDVGNWTVLGGVRVEQTDLKTTGASILFDEENSDGDAQFGTITGTQDYTDVLPMLNAKYRFNEKTQMRLAITRGISRPNFQDVAPLQVIEIEEDDGEFERKAEIGNPNLDPYRVNNFDLGIEYYPGDISVMSAGLFYKDIQDFVVLADLAGQGPWVGFDEVISPVNGDDADLWGVELNYTKQFSELPGWASGLMLVANYTWTDSEASVPFRTTDIPLPRQSENIANLALGYEDYNFSIRIAATYRDAYLIELGELDDPAFDIYADDHLQWDFSAKYLLNENAQMYFEAVNIGDEPFYAYNADSRYNAQYESYGWTAQLGLRLFF